MKIKIENGALIIDGEQDMLFSVNEREYLIDIDKSVTDVYPDVYVTNFYGSNLEKINMDRLLTHIAKTRGHRLY